MYFEVIAETCLVWYVSVLVVCTIGWIQLIRHYSTVPKQSVSSNLDHEDIPHVTIIRPVKDQDPYLYECLAATFNQDYPSRKLTIYFCVPSRNDPAFAVLENLLHDFPQFDAKIFVEHEDPLLLQQQCAGSPTGPNPKIRNMSRAYREANGDIVWIIDCNVWVASGVCGRMVDQLCGLSKSGPGRPCKLVHQLPICVDVGSQLSEPGSKRILNENQTPTPRRWWQLAAGGRLEEIFLSSSHAKFYTAINTVALAPCLVGKSNMFRRSHLNHLTSSTSERSKNTTHSIPTAGEGIDFFSHYICEDHLIGDLLWRSSIPSEPDLANHSLVLGDLAIQPIASMSVRAYIARRVRWLRVRKFTVTLATLVEPGTESFLCSAYGAFAVTRLEWFKLYVGIPHTWKAFVGCWLLSISAWALVDWTVYLVLHSGRTMFKSDDKRVPSFARPLTRFSRRPFPAWLAAWLGREILALPIWIWAFWGGVTVVWRDQKFWVGTDMRVHQLEHIQPPHHSTSTSTSFLARKPDRDARNRNKTRSD